LNAGLVRVREEERGIDKTFKIRYPLKDLTRVPGKISKKRSISTEGEGPTPIPKKDAGNKVLGLVFSGRWWGRANRSRRL